MSEFNERLKAWANVAEKSISADLQKVLPHKFETLFLITDQELYFIPKDSTDSVKLVMTWPDNGWEVEVNPSILAPGGYHDPARFRFSSQEDAVSAMLMFKNYYDMVVKPNMENM